MHKKILHIITLSNWGGAQQICYNIVTNLNKNKYTIEVACGPGGELINRLRDSGVTVHVISSLQRNISPLNDLKSLLSLYRLIRKNQYDAVHCHSTKAGLLGRLAAWLAKTPRIYFTVHGWGFYNVVEYGHLQWLLILFEKLCALISTKIICISERVKQDGMRKKVASEDKFIVIHNGTANYIYHGQSKLLRNQIKASDTDVVFGMVARLTYQKNPLLFLNAAAKVVQIYKSAKFVLVGDGPLYKDCENFIRKKQLKNHIFMLGFRRDIPKLLKNLDVFVLSSKFEGFGLSIVEAMFAGLPIIATDVEGINEIVQQGENGFLTKPDSVNSLAEKMIYFIKHPKKRVKMGKKSQKIAVENFSLDKMIKKYERLYSWE